MSEMTVDELRNKLAEALHYEARQELRDIGRRELHAIWCLYKGDELVYESWYGETKEDVLRQVPDWPCDTGAALALCRQLAIANDYELLLSWSGAYTFASFSPLSMAGIRWSHEARSTDASTTPDGHDAEALARLAWEYYRGVGKK